MRVRKLKKPDRSVLEPRKCWGLSGMGASGLIALVVACVMGFSSAITVDIAPDALNVYNDSGNYITAYIEGPFDGPLLFADDFELNWEDPINGGEWTVVQEAGTSNHVFQARSVAPDQGTAVFKGDTSWEDYVLEARVYTTDSYWGLIVRADSSGSTFYSAYLNVPESAAEIWKHPNGVWTSRSCLVKNTWATPTIVAGQWYDVKVVVTGQKIDLYYKLDGPSYVYPSIPQASATDSTYLSGRIGLMFYDDGVSTGKVGLFDDVSVAASSGNVLSDDFEPKWTVVPGGNGATGQWIIERDLSTSGVGHSLDWVYSVVPADKVEEISVVTGDVSWTDYVLEYKVKINQMMGVAGNEGSAFIRADANAQNGYLIHPYIGGICIYKLVSDGNPTTYDYQGPYANTGCPTIAADTWCLIRAEAVGPTITISVNGVQVVTWTDTAAPIFLNGKVGVRQGDAARHAHYDDVVVWGLNCYDVSLIDVSSLELWYGNTYLAAVDPAAPTTIGDHDNDGLKDLMVKFPRGAVVTALKSAGVVGGMEIELTIKGTSVDGFDLSGSDSLVTAMAKGKMKT